MRFAPSIAMRSPHLLAGVSCALLLAFAAVTSAETDMLLIFDASGSMKAKTPEGVTRIDAAKEAFSKLTDTLKADSVGLMIFGHRLSSKDPKACQDIELAIPFGKLNAAKFRGTVGGIQALGNTPLAGSLLKAKDALLGLEKDSQKAIVLFTDGIESCGGNPEAVARELAAMGINVKVHVVGFAGDAESAGKLKAIADAGGGKFVLAKNAGEREEALPQLEKTAQPGTENKEGERATSGAIMSSGFRRRRRNISSRCYHALRPVRAGRRHSAAFRRFRRWWPGRGPLQ